MTKVEGNYATINAKKNYLVYNAFKAGRMQKSRHDVTVRIVVISPHICCLLHTEEGKNNAIYVL